VNVVLIAVGVVLIVIVFVDAVLTTMTAGNGAGPMTVRFGRLQWRALRAASGGQPWPLLSHAGALILLVTFGMWVLLMWAGWSLIFLGAGEAIVDASTGAPASTPATIYYAGFVVFTLGVGDFIATTGAWQVVTAVASLLGLFLVTLSITYLISVVSAAVTRRQFAQSVSVLGTTGVDIVLGQTVDGELSSQFSSQTQQLTSQLLKMTQQHLAYPVLHFFHASNSAASAPLGVAALDDALVVLDSGVDSSGSPAHDVLGTLQRAIEHYADTVHTTGADGSISPPPLPPLEPLAAAGLPTVEQSQYVERGASHAERRRTLHRIVRSDARQWPTAPTG
jgi:hypothetical protein